MSRRNKTGEPKKFGKAILRMVDICVAVYLRRGVRWKEEPYRTATETEWRIGWFFVACFPICMLVFMGSNSFNSFIEHAGDKQHPIVLLYIAFIGFVLIGGGGLHQNWAKSASLFFNSYGGSRLGLLHLVAGVSSIENYLFVTII